MGLRYLLKQQEKRKQRYFFHEFGGEENSAFYKKLQPLFEGTSTDLNHIQQHHVRFFMLARTNDPSDTSTSL